MSSHDSGPMSPDEDVKAVPARHLRIMRNIMFEAHAMLCLTYQAHLNPMNYPSNGADAGYESPYRVWNLEPSARDFMTAPEQHLFDALMESKEMMQ